jgi:hypothetical protein
MLNQIFCLLNLMVNVTWQKWLSPFIRCLRTLRAGSVFVLPWPSTYCTNPIYRVNYINTNCIVSRLCWRGSFRPVIRNSKSYCLYGLADSTCSHIDSGFEIPERVHNIYQPLANHMFIHLVVNFHSPCSNQPSKRNICFHIQCKISTDFYLNTILTLYSNSGL